MLRRARQALRHGRRPDGDDVDRRPGGRDPGAPRPARREELEARLDALRGEVELPIPAASAVKIGGERAYRLPRRGVEVEMPVRRSQVYALDVIAYTGDQVRLELHVSSGTYVRSIAAALGGHCVTLRRTAVGPFSVEEADPARLVPVPKRSAACRRRRLERVPDGLRAQVLALRGRDSRLARCCPAAPPRARGHVKVASTPGDARAEAARGRDRHVRRRPPRPPGGRADGASRPAARRRWSRSIRTLARCSATTSSCSPRSSGGSSCSTRSESRRRSWSSSLPQVASVERRGVRAEYVARSGRRGRRRRRGVPLRTQAGRRPRRVRAARSQAQIA